jgi:DNA-binding response OmpR family regulator
MRVLLADDDAVPRCLLQAALTEWGYEVEAVADGERAWQILQAEGAPKLAVLDWVMPGLDGVEVCRRLRARPAAAPVYAILLTARDSKADVVAGLRAGANDYVTKPFDRAELQARVQVGRTVVELQHNLAARVRELEDALAQVRQLQGLLPICSYCKKIRDDNNYWQQVESYLGAHSGARFSHGICPDCWQNEVNAELARHGIAVPAK